MFDWKTFLTQHHIDHSARARNNLTAYCPMCGDSDLGRDNMSLSTTGKGWRCWRNPSEHRGRNPARLIQAYLRCSWERACEIAGVEPTPQIVNENIADTVAGMLGRASIEAPKPTEIWFPREFHSLLNGSHLAKGFLAYLHARGYSQQEAWQLAADYNLQYAIIGVWRYRLIIPFYDSLGKLVSWTGRSIVPDEKLRYKTLDSKTALVMPTSLLLSLPMLWTASYPKALIICEGPFDAMRITVTGAASGVYGTCLFGLQISDAQVALLEQLATRFKLYLLLDHDAQMQAFGISQRLARLGCEVLLMPYDVKDPGALSSAQTSTFITEVLYRMEGNHARKNG